LKTITRIVLEKRSRHIEWKRGNWEKGYCPVCGTFPTIAMIKEKIAERWLHCSHFFVENKDKECAFACDKCKRYLITLTRMSDLIIRDLDISAISLIHLDIIMQGRGFQPMATCEWNAV